MKQDFLKALNGNMKVKESMCQFTKKKKKQEWRLMKDDDGENISMISYEMGSELSY